jgi:hypothetical protein
LEHIVIPPDVALLTGTGYHKGAEANFRQKIESHQDLPEKEIVEAAVAGFETELAGGYSLSREEVSIGTDKVLGTAKDEVARLAALHAREVAPDYQPVAVEETVRIELPNATHDMLGVLDLRDDQDRIIDFKTAGKKKNQADADNNQQLTVYAAGYHIQRGKPPAALRLDFAVKTKTPYRHILETTRSPRDYQVLVNRINAMLAAIKSGNFPPAAPGTWWCSTKFCGYARQCPYFNAQRNTDVE